MTNSEILTSTGGLGLEYRSHDRLYLNSRFGMVRSIAFLERQYEYAQKTLARGFASRVVGRYIVSEKVYEELMGNEKLATVLEAGVPIEDWSGAVLGRVVMFGLNHQSRRPWEDLHTMVERTSLRPASSLEPHERIQRFQEEGVQFVDRVYPWMVPQVEALWSETFGWSTEQIYNLQEGVNHQTKWFSAAIAGKKVYSIAMAERLDMPFGDGRWAHIVESTEWRTSPGNERRGLMAATVAYLNEQVVADLQTSKLPPLIIAETNYRSSSYYVGWATGMEIPDRPEGIGLRQVLVQNVEVVDGHVPRGLRDFIFMYLPLSIMTNHYGYVLKGAT